MSTEAQDAHDANRMNPFGPGASADETRQAQHTKSNDTPSDVNMEAIVARSQALTVDIAGKDYQGNADRRGKLFDHAGAKLAQS